MNEEKVSAFLADVRAWLEMQNGATVDEEQTTSLDVSEGDVVLLEETVA
jgi:hypothetical protein